MRFFLGYIDNNLKSDLANTLNQVSVNTETISIFIDSSGGDDFVPIFQMLKDCNNPIKLFVNQVSSSAFFLLLKLLFEHDKLVSICLSEVCYAIVHTMTFEGSVRGRNKNLFTHYVDNSSYYNNYIRQIFDKDTYDKFLSGSDIILCHDEINAIITKYKPNLLNNSVVLKDVTWGARDE